MASSMRGLGSSKGCSSMAKSKRKKPLQAWLKRMRVCVCVYVRSLHSKLPLKLEEELNSQMSTLASFFSQ